MTRTPTPTPTPTRGDAGFTLTELLVSIGIFSLLMVLITTVYISGLRTITDVNMGSALQQEQQNAILWLSRLLRYTDNPKDGASTDPAITAATATAMTFYTFSGTGAVADDRKPFLATIRMNGTDVISEIKAPVGSAGSFTWPNAAATRVLVQGTPTHTPTLQLRYYDGNGTQLVPPADPTLVPAWGQSVSSVRVTITDSSTAQAADQTVQLVNPR